MTYPEKGENKMEIKAQTIWAAVIIGILCFAIGGAVFYNFASGEEIDNENYFDADYLADNFVATELVPTPANGSVTINGILYTIPVEVEEETVMLTELDEHLAVREAAVALFLEEWKDEFEFKDVDGDYGDANETYDYEEVVEDLGLDIALEDYPNVEKSYDLLDDVTADEVDIKDNEWETEFTVEIEIDGTDYEYTVTGVVEDGVADDLELAQV